MSGWTGRIEYLPKSGTPAEVPRRGIAVQYYIRWPDEPKELTPDRCRRVLKNLREGRWSNIYLTSDATMERDYLQLESGSGLFVLLYVRDNSGGAGEEAAQFTTYDPPPDTGNRE